MVPIIERSVYITDLRKNAKYDLFFSWLFSTNPKELFKAGAEVDKIFQNTIESLIDQDKKKFDESYKNIARREPSKYSPFTNDDLLLFVLITGAKKFSKDLEWVQKVLTIRESSDFESQTIKKTFQNIIRDNYESSDNAFQIIIALESVLSNELISWHEKKQFYESLTTKDFPFFKSEFLNITALKAYDIIITQGDKSDYSYYYYLKEFERRFMKKTQKVSWSVFFFTCLLVAGVIVWLVFNPKYEGLMGKFDTIFGLLGVAIFSIWRKRVVSWIESKIRKFWGHIEKSV